MGLVISFLTLRVAFDKRWRLKEGCMLRDLSVVLVGTGIEALRPKASMLRTAVGVIGLGVWEGAHNVSCRLERHTWGEVDW